jgi:hypothetical protein
MSVALPLANWVINFKSYEVDIVKIISTSVWMVCWTHQGSAGRYSNWAAAPVNFSSARWIPNLLKPNFLSLQHYLDPHQWLPLHFRILHPKIKKSSICSKKLYLPLLQSTYFTTVYSKVHKKKNELLGITSMDSMFSLFYAPFTSTSSIKRKRSLRVHTSWPLCNRFFWMHLLEQQNETALTGN